MNTHRTTAALLVAVLLAGCATASKDISAQSVSPLQYQVYDCAQLAQEQARLEKRIGELTARLDGAAAVDQVLVTAGLFLFWPALLFIGGTTAEESEYSHVKGEYEAVQQATIAARCEQVRT